MQFAFGIVIINFLTSIIEIQIYIYIYIFCIRTHNACAMAIRVDKISVQVFKYFFITQCTLLHYSH